MLAYAYEVAVLATNGRRPGTLVRVALKQALDDVESDAHIYDHIEIVTMLDQCKMDRFPARGRIPLIRPDCGNKLKSVRGEELAEISQQVFQSSRFFTRWRGYFRSIVARMIVSPSKAEGAFLPTNLAPSVDIRPSFKSWLE